MHAKPMSSLLVDDCEAYKHFLANPDPRFVGERFARHSPCWRPFASGELSAESQRYAIRELRGAFAWLVDVRYLAGNPWTAVNDPPVVQRASDSMSASGAHSLAQSLALFIAPLVGFSDDFAAGFARDRAEAASLLPPLGYRRKT
jgi:hypothetical protein